MTWAIDAPGAPALAIPFTRTTTPGVRHQDSRIFVGDARERLRDMPDASVHCVVTSPPYYGLRDYGTAEWTGGDPACEHQVAVTKGRGVWEGAEALEGSDRPKHVHGAPHRGGVRQRHCAKCAATLLDRQIGLEDSLREYVEALVDVFREVRRVLRPDGVVWLNLGDSYAGGNSGQRVEGINQRMLDRPGDVATQGTADRARGQVAGFKDKDLIGVPWRVAFALQDDGWWLRSDVVWSKPNPVPESVRDRPTRSHEYVFLLTASSRYHYDREAILEPSDSGPSDQRKIAEGRARSNDVGYRQADPSMVNGAGGQLGRAAAVGDGLTRNRRTVWTIATQPFKEAHFAVFPPNLAEPCVLAGTSPLACGECGAAYKRIVERTRSYASHSALAGRDPGQLESTGKYADEDRSVNGSRGTVRSGPVVESRTVGWRPGCVCGAPPALKMRPDDMEVIESPAGEGGTDDPTLEVGRRGLARERGEGAGTTTMTRYEQRMYAAQLVALGKHDQHRYDLLRDEAGHEAFQHYRRKDRVGARAIPAELLEAWIAEAALDRVTVPSWAAPTPTDCVVLDPFAGSGTVGVVAGWHGRCFVGVELSEANAKLAVRRITREGRPGRKPAAAPIVSDDQLTLIA